MRTTPLARQPWLAIVAYRCEVAGAPTDSIDIQVRYFTADCVEEIESQIRLEPIHSYTNPIGELVTWPLIGVLAADRINEQADGCEVVGFITGCHEFVKWASGTPKEHPPAAQS